MQLKETQLPQTDFEHLDQKNPEIEQAYDYFDRFSKNKEWGFFKALRDDCDEHVLGEYERNFSLVLENFEVEQSPVRTVGTLSRIIAMFKRNDYGMDWDKAKQVTTNSSVRICQRILDLLSCEVEDDHKKEMLELVVNLRNLDCSSHQITRKIISENSNYILNQIRYKPNKELTLREKYIEQFGVSRLYNVFAWLEVAAGVVAYGDKTTANKVDQAMKKIGETVPEIYPKFIGQLFYYSHMSQPCEIIQPYYLQTLSKYQLKDTDTLRDFMENLGNTKIGIANSLLNHFINLKQLGEIDINAPSVLQKQYNISFFGRYPIEVLKDMFEQTITPRKSNYVVAIYAKTDWNGAFQYQTNLSRLYEELTQSAGHTLKIIEVSNLNELVLQLANLRNKFGKASGIVVSGHGDGAAISLGKRSNINMDNFSQTREGRLMGLGLDKFFKPNSTVIFNSCNAGKNNGLLHNLSEFYPVRMVGCDQASATKNISVTKTQEGLFLEAEYFEGKAQVFFRGEKTT